MTKSHHFTVCIPDFPFSFLRSGLVSYRENYRPYIFLPQVLLHYDQLFYFTFKESVKFKTEENLEGILLFFQNSVLELIFPEIKE